MKMQILEMSREEIFKLKTDGKTPPQALPQFYAFASTYRALSDEEMRVVEAIVDLSSTFSVWRPLRAEVIRKGAMYRTGDLSFDRVHRILLTMRDAGLVSLYTIPEQFIVDGLYVLPKNPLVELVMNAYYKGQLTAK